MPSFGVAWRGNTALAFLSNAVKDKHCRSKLEGVHGKVGAANIIFHHFKVQGSFVITFLISRIDLCL